MLWFSCGPGRALESVAFLRQKTFGMSELFRQIRVDHVIQSVFCQCLLLCTNANLEQMFDCMNPIAIMPDAGSYDEEERPMKCRICGSSLKPIKTDLPFKVSERTIVIVKELPVVQCESCSAYEIENPVFSRVEELLSAIDRATELEIIRFVA
jgi:YgiT-type zinc finger domain-containing protein